MDTLHHSYDFLSQKPYTVFVDGTRREAECKVILILDGKMEVWYFSRPKYCVPYMERYVKDVESRGHKATWTMILKPNW